MKKSLFIQYLLISFLIFPVVSCDNEKLEGEFVSDNCFQRIADTGEFRADVEGFDFRAEIEIDPESIFENFAIIFIQLDGTLTLDIDAFNVASTSDSNFETSAIAISIVNPEVGVYDLATNNEYGPAVVSENEPFEHYGWYYEGPLFIDGIPPYVSYVPNGGFGEAEITEFNEDEQYVSGTFSFTSKRIKTDPLTEEPILDENGNEIIETKIINCGNFNRLPYVYIDLGDNNQNSSNNDFFAKVEGTDFIPVSVTATRVEFDPENIVIKIEAINSIGDLLRIDIPEDLTEGTYDMVSLSDGTELIGMYNPTLTASENLTSNPGTITITDINSFTGDVDATFSFIGTDPLGIDPAVVEVTEGNFSIDYIPSVNTINVITAEVNNEDYFSDYAESSTSIFNGITRYQFYSIENSSGQRIRLILPETIDVGSYDISSTLITGEEILALYTFDDGTTPTLVANSGSLTVTAFNEDTGLLEGAFEFLAIDTTQDPPVEYVASNGEFTLFLE